MELVLSSKDLKSKENNKIQNDKHRPENDAKGENVRLIHVVESFEVVVPSAMKSASASAITVDVLLDSTICPRR